MGTDVSTRRSLRVIDNLSFFWEGKKNQQEGEQMDGDIQNGILLIIINRLFLYIVTQYWTSIITTVCVHVQLS